MASKKIVVILEGTKDWNPWKQTIRTTAVNEGVWDMIDPEKWSSPEGDTIYEADTDPANIPLPSDGETLGQAPRRLLGIPDRGENWSRDRSILSRRTLTQRSSI
jgi:hypothetical protein